MKEMTLDTGLTYFLHQHYMDFVEIFIVLLDSSPQGGTSYICIRGCA